MRSFVHSIIVITEEAAEIRRGGLQRSEDADENLLQEGSAGLAQRIADHIDGSFAL